MWVIESAYRRRKERASAWCKANKERMRELQKQWAKKNPEKVRQHVLKRDQERVRKTATAWRRKNPDKVREYWRRQRLRISADPSLRIANALRTRLLEALRGRDKSRTTFELIGCSRHELVAHLEAQFQGGMTWENYGEWHVDHKRPLAWFDLRKPSQQRRACHYTNLQPLWASDNWKKGARWAASLKKSTMPIAPKSPSRKARR